VKCNIASRVIESNLIHIPPSPYGYYLFNAVILRQSTILKTAFDWEIDIYSLWNAVYHESTRSEDLNQFIAGKSLKKLSTRLLYSNERADT
jgi:hypothetical protein